MGFTSNWFYPTKGLHQGCCASVFYFILVLELLGQQLRNNKKFKGITVENIKSMQFADDMNLFSPFDEISIQAAIDTLILFEGNTLGLN